MKNSRVLLMTVGTGDMNNVEGTLLRPLELSASQGEWDRVILLPSQVTRSQAEQFRGRLREARVDLRPLPRRGAENDADECFLHYDSLLADLLHEGVPCGAIVIDFTRGTKAMSAALVLAAVARGVPQLRYIWGERDSRGMVKPGSERVSDLNALTASTRRDLQRAADFMEQGQLAAAVRLFASPGDPMFYPAALRAEVRMARWLGEFWGAWDRFDYREAWEAAGRRPQQEAGKAWRRFLPSAGHLRLLERLAGGWPDESRRRAAAARDLTADVLENARRRLKLREEEDALIRAYRVLELIGQARLFDQELDSSRLDTTRSDVQEWLKYKEEKKREPIRPDRRGRTSIGQQQVGSLLKWLKDPLAEKLLKMESREFSLLTVTKRNYSLLIHGFEAQSAGKMQEFGTLLDSLEALFLEDEAGNAARLRDARFPF